MDNVKFIDIENPLNGEIVTHAIIVIDENSYTSMPKSVYDEQQAAQTTQSEPGFFQRLVSKF